MPRRKKGSRLTVRKGIDSRGRKTQRTRTKNTQAPIQVDDPIVDEGAVALGGDVSDIDECHEDVGSSIGTSEVTRSGRTSAVASPYPGRPIEEEKSAQSPMEAPLRDHDFVFPVHHIVDCPRPLDIIVERPSSTLKETATMKSKGDETGPTVDDNIIVIDSSPESSSTPKRVIIDDDATCGMSADKSPEPPKKKIKILEDVAVNIDFDSIQMMLRTKPPVRQESKKPAAVQPESTRRISIHDFDDPEAGTSGYIPPPTALGKRQSKPKIDVYKRRTAQEWCLLRGELSSDDDDIGEVPLPKPRATKPWMRNETKPPVSEKEAKERAAREAKEAEDLCREYGTCMSPCTDYCEVFPELKDHFYVLQKSENVGNVVGEVLMNDAPDAVAATSALIHEDAPEDDTEFPQNEVGNVANVGNALANAVPVQLDINVEQAFADDIAALAADIREGDLMDDPDIFENEVVAPPRPDVVNAFPVDQIQHDQILAEIERVRNRAGQKRTYLLATTRQVDVYRLSQFNQICPHCSARFFNEERTHHRAYNKCCNGGKFIHIPPLGETPELLRNLLDGNDGRSGEFRRNILAYNHAFQFASIEVNFRDIPGRGPYVYAIQGKFYHKIGDINVRRENNRKYSAIYFIDPEQALQQRLANDGRVRLNENLLIDLQDLLHDINIFAREFRHLGEVFDDMARELRADNAPLPVLQLQFVAQHRNNRPFDTPVVSEIAAVYDVNEEMPPLPTLRVFTRERDIGLREIDPHSAFCDPLTYPLLFPNGEPGWNFDLDWTKRPHKVTLADYYGYRLAYRDLPYQIIQRSGRLVQLYVVDAYIKIEANRLLYYREHQADMRVENYTGLTDYLNNQAEIDESEVGKKIILPSEFLGGPRSQMQRFQDAMAVVRKFGHPSLFITFTCNPKWPDIVENIPRGDEVGNHPLLVARVFRAKLQELMHDINVKHVFGVPVAHLLVIEFQKRGLPHAHILVTLRHEDKPQDPIRIDQIISAQIPDPDQEPRLYELVGRHMIHGPCGTFNPNSVCMVDGQCTKKFPKCWAEQTSIQGSFVTLKRPRNFRSVQIRRNNVLFSAMNPFVVPHNPYLLLKYDAHINVEPCVSIKSIKYLYKYFFKGEDRASVKFTWVDDGGVRHVDYDEIQAFLNGRYMTAPEASWRIMKFPLHDNSHTIVRLDVHLPQQHQVYFQPGMARDVVERRTTTLLKWFELNARDPAARQYFYHEIPLHFVWKNKEWQPRVYNKKVITRIYNVSPRNQELYCLRLLLFHVTGATSFEDLRTVDGVVSNTFADACRSRNLLSEDREWFNCMREASERDMPRQMRSVFAYILVFGNIEEAPALWREFRRFMFEDFLRRRIPENDAEIRALQHIQWILEQNGTRLSRFGFEDPPVAARAPPVDDFDQEHERVPQEDGEQNLERLNHAQRDILDIVLRAVLDPDVPDRLFYLSGAAGTRKTFLYNTLISVLQNRGVKVLTMARSGLAASLLRGGRTVHSQFQLPVPTGENSTSGITPLSEAGQRIREVQLIIWDEISMASRILFHAVERALRDICQDERPFAGKTILIGGDFKQCLPIVVCGDRTTIVEACVKGSPLWASFQRLELNVNMRAERDEIEFVDFIERLGNDRLPTMRYIHNDLISLPDRCVVACKQELMDHVFGDAIEQLRFDAILNRAVLTPLNADCDEINSHILAKLPGEMITYLGVDSVVSDDEEEVRRYPQEFLNNLCPAGYPPHRLMLRTNAVIMLLRNLNVHEGLCNGTRLIVTHLAQHLIEAEVIDFRGQRTGRRVLIPRIDLSPTTATLPFVLRRRQFPVKLSYAITINKSQGMSFDRLGIYLPRPIFSHGQLYVAFSRARTFDGVRVYVERTGEQGRVFHENNSIYTKNIVYGEVL